MHSREQTSSVWMQTTQVPLQQPLRADTHADVCVVGAGIAGMTTAYLLTRAGRSVVVLDDGPIAGGQTQRTTAHLSNAIDDRIFEVERVHGAEGARLAVESHGAAIDRIEAIVRDEAIDCAFRRLDGYLFLGAGDTIETLDKERDAARRAGLTDVDFVLPPSGLFDAGRCLRFPQQGQFHPLRYLAGLARAVEQRGGHIFTGTHVTSIESGSPARVTTQAGPVVTAQAVVVATNTPINDRVALHTKLSLYLTYVIGGVVPAGLITPALYWDTLEFYHYIRLQSLPDGRELLIIGGEDHKSGQAVDQEQRWGRLEEWARPRFPMLGSIDYRWSGMVMETIDGLAFIGRNPGDDNVYVATGDSGMGMTHGTIAGMLLAELIHGRDHPWSKIYDPRRKPVRGMAWKEFVSENLNVAKEYAKDWLSGGDVSDVDKVPPGQGAVLRRGLTKVAVYRDETGTTHECSAICPHLACIVHWNGAEKTWDCPCHGSRFDSFGAVIQGPANRALTPLGEPAHTSEGT
jgi:glycine/D-amino acid oxidase-like deaminating enzyme/nitrite reductase/ring-hydroxylating ferredoxin subunit